MPPPTKRQKQARQQRASGAKCFHDGLVEDLLEMAMDPNYYQLDRQDANSDEDNKEDSSTVGDMSFSLFDCTVEGESEPCSEESDIDIICTGEKRKGCNDLEGVLEEFGAEDAPDYMEECAHKAAASAHHFWADMMNPVSLEAVNHIPCINSNRMPRRAASLQNCQRSPCPHIQEQEEQRLTCRNEIYDVLHKITVKLLRFLHLGLNRS